MHFGLGAIRESIASQPAGFRPISTVDTLGRRSRWSRTYENQNALPRCGGPRRFVLPWQPALRRTTCPSRPAVEAPVADAAANNYVGDVYPGIQRGYGQPDLFLQLLHARVPSIASTPRCICPPCRSHPMLGIRSTPTSPFTPTTCCTPIQDRFHRHYDCGRGMNRTRASLLLPAGTSSREQCLLELPAYATLVPVTNNGTEV